MSRTYRFRKSNYKIHEDRVLIRYDWRNCDYTFTHIDPDSKEGKERLARFHSDVKKRAWIKFGPMWFYNLYCQRPYRRNAKYQIQRYIKDTEFEIQLRRKPSREYWW